MAEVTNLCPYPFGGPVAWNLYTPTTANGSVELVEGVADDEVPVGTSFQRATVTTSAASIGMRTPLVPGRALMPALATGWVRSPVAAAIRWRIDAWRGAAAVPTYTLYRDVTARPGEWLPAAVSGDLYADADIDTMRVSVFYVASQPVGTTLDVAGVLMAEGSPPLPPFLVGTRDLVTPRFEVAAYGAPVLADAYAWDGTPASYIDVVPAAWVS